MKQSYLVIAILSGLLPLGCQSPTLNPSRMTAGLFGKKDQNHTIARNSLGDVAPKTNSVAKASEDYTKAEAALKKGNLREARKLLVSVVQQDPQHVEAHHRLAFVADKSGDYQMAELHYLTAHRLQPRNADIACDLGYSYLLQERYDDSRRFLEKALAVNPQHQASLLNLASLHAQQGDYDTALALFRKAGTEQQAQANIAQLFPAGPPSAEDRQAAAARMAQQTSPANRELQQRIAQARKNSKSQEKRELDLNNIDPREIPPHQINELFAQIDDEYERNRLSAPPVSPKNAPDLDDPRIVQAGPGPLNNQPTVPVLHTQQQPGSQNRQESPYYSSLPGDLPVSQNTPAAPAMPPWGQMEQNRPQMQSQSPQSQPELTSPAFAVQTTQSPFPDIQPAPPARQKGPLQLIDPLASSPTPQAPPDASSPEYQQALSRALQMGMNAGPGQMFPVQSGNHTQTSNKSQNTPADVSFSPHPFPETSGTPSGPALGQTTSVQRMITPTGGVEFPYLPGQHSGHQNSAGANFSQQPPALQAPIPHQPTQPQWNHEQYQPTHGMPQPATLPTQTPSASLPPATGHETQYQSQAYAPVRQGEYEVRNWPHAPTPAQLPAEATARPAGNHSQRPPWMQQPEPITTQPSQHLPTLQPSPQPTASYAQPAQWQYAPPEQASGSAQPVSEPYTRRTQPAAAPSASPAPLPHVVPGVR